MKVGFPFFIKFSLALELAALAVKLAAMVVVSGAAIYSETLHSLADVMDSVFLYVGMRLSRRPPDASHPFGYGKETFFWALVTAMFMVSVTATLSITKGIGQFVAPEPLHHPGFGIWSMAVGTALSLATLAMGARLIFRGRKLDAATFRSYIDPSVKVKVAEDVAAVAGNLLALAAVYLFSVTGSLAFDAAAAVLVGALLAFLGFAMARESKDLIIGRSADRRQRKAIVKAVMSVREVVRVMDMKTMLMGPDEILVNVEVNLVDGLETDEVEKVMDKIRERIQHALPGARHIQVEAESPHGQ